MTYRQLGLCIFLPSAHVKLCKLRTPQDWKEREERKKRGKSEVGGGLVYVCVCLEVEMSSREEECETFLMLLQWLFTR